MLTLRPSARPSISAQLTVRAVSPSTASSAPMEPSSTRTTSSVTGGSTLTAMKLRVCTQRMRRLLLSARPPLPLPLTRLPTELLLLPATLQELHLPLLQLPTLGRPLLLLHRREHIRVLREKGGSWATGRTTGGEEDSSSSSNSREEIEDSEDKECLFLTPSPAPLSWAEEWMKPFNFWMNGKPSEWWQMCSAQDSMTLFASQLEFLLW